MNYDVFLSLLALDSYNRGYSPNVTVDEDADKIGTASIEDIPLPNGSISAGFYASVYHWNGETIISYRGTPG